MMAQANRIRVFVSEYWKRNGADYGRPVITHLMGADDLELVNLEPAAWNPVEARMPGIVRAELERRIRASDLVLVAASFHGQADREWAAFELHAASLANAPVLAVAPEDAASVPRIYTEHPDATVIESSPGAVLAAIRAAAHAVRQTPSRVAIASRAALWDAVEQRSGGVSRGPHAPLATTAMGRMQGLAALMRRLAARLSAQLSQAFADRSA